MVRPSWTRMAESFHRKGMERSIVSVHREAGRVVT